MKILAAIVLLSVTVANAAAFVPMPLRHRVLTARSMGILGEWQKFFSPEEQRHRSQDHEKEMQEMRDAQKEILDRRRDPNKMDSYHHNEEVRHEQLDKKRDLEVEEELAKEQVVDAKLEQGNDLFGTMTKNLFGAKKEKSGK